MLPDFVDDMAQSSRYEIPRFNLPGKIRINNLTNAGGNIGLLIASRTSYKITKLIS